MMTRAPEEPVSRFLRSADGLRLHYHDYAPCGDETGAPILCLPGLARNALDFQMLAGALAHSGRRVAALDYRGRGLSDWDPDWSHYSIEVEQDDILRAAADAGIDRAAIVGTSRGGLHAMRLAVARPELVAAAVLNDIGPQINLAGLLVIKRYVGRLPPLSSIEDAVALMRASAGAAFSEVTMDQWRVFARQTFVEKDGKVELLYDPDLSHTLDDVEPGKEPEADWEGFDALAQKPLLTLRGENSEILTPDILARMAARAPRMRQHIVPGQAHPPLLLDTPTISLVVEFLTQNS